MDSLLNEPLVPGLRAENLLVHMADAFVVLDHDWRIVYANREAERINRKEAKDFLGKTLWEEWPESVGTELERQYRTAMDTGMSVRFEHPLGNDPSIWLEINAFPCEAGLATYYHDITARKQNEDQLLRREQELTEFIENAAVGLHWVAPDGTILWTNEAELRMFGYGREEYIGRNIREFHVDEEVIRDILQRLTDGERIQEYEARIRCKDNSIRHVVISSSTFRREGEFIHTQCLTRDITDKKQAHEAQTRLAAIVESSDDAIISKDLNGIIQTWNRGAERIFGYTAEEAIGQPIALIATPDRIDELPNILGRICRGERVDHYETRRRTKDGRILTVSLTISPIRDSRGKVVGASKVARDVTERERNEEALRKNNEELRQANLDLQRFAYSASHDLQEPLRMVTLFGQKLKKTFAEQLGPQGAEYIRYIVEGSARMQNLLRDLLAYTECSSVVEPAGVVADANEAVASALANLGVAVEESGAIVTYGELPAVQMRHVELDQLFQNLIGNSIKYRSNERPTIEITASPADASWLFSVKDNGIGIDSRYREQIFELFKRLHTADEYPGTGLGLAICQRIVHRCGGRIWVESQPGRGSTFYFILPKVGG